MANFTPTQLAQIDTETVIRLTRIIVSVMPVMPVMELACSSSSDGNASDASASDTSDTYDPSDRFDTFDTSDTSDTSASQAKDDKTAVYRWRHGSLRKVTDENTDPKGLMTDSEPYYSWVPNVFTRRNGKKFKFSVPMNSRTGKPLSPYDIECFDPSIDVAALKKVLDEAEKSHLKKVLDEAKKSHFAKSEKDGDKLGDKLGPQNSSRQTNAHIGQNPAPDIPAMDMGR